MKEFDIAVIGGGINGCGIARDAAGRGLKVALCEAEDLGGATSSASSKLIHGGLRYLEQREWKLVRESLRERESLLQSAPHLVRPLQFILPHCARLRPAWMIRAGLFLYDMLGGGALARSKSLQLDAHHRTAKLRGEFARGFSYADCAVDDSRLVVTVAKHARALGAEIFTRAPCVHAKRDGAHWQLAVQHGGARMQLRAKVLVNATGPWAMQFLRAQENLAPQNSALQLVQGSHIAVKKWFAGAHAYILQNHDRRVIFVLPFHDLALIGTTERAFSGDARTAKISDAETEYLCAAVKKYFAVQLTPRDVVWAFSGVRALFDARADSLRTLTRDYVLQAAGAPPLLNVFGGKLTTFRKLSENAMQKLARHFPSARGDWTLHAKLPGGNLQNESREDFESRHPFLPAETRARCIAAYGGDAFQVFAGAHRAEQLGAHFGHGLFEREVEYLRAQEWAACAEDILWRRSKLGLRFTAAQAAALQKHFSH